MILETLDIDFSLIMKGEYTNYMFSSLISRCNQVQRLKVISKIKDNILEIASHTKGTHPLQILISLSTSEEEESEVFDAIRPFILDLVKVLIIKKDQNGTHFMQKIVSHYSNARFMIVYKIVMNNFLDIVNNKAGVCVVNFSKKDENYYRKM